MKLLSGHNLAGAGQLLAGHGLTLISTLSAALNGLTAGIAEIGDHAAITVALPSGVTAWTSQAWGTSYGDTTYGSGASPTDFAAGEGTLLRFEGLGDDGNTYRAAALIYHPTPIAAAGLANQSFTDDSGIQTFDVSGDFTFAGTGVYSVQSGPAGVTVDANTGVVSHDTGTLAEQAGTAIVIRLADSLNPARSDDSGYQLTITATVGPTVPLAPAAPTPTLVAATSHRTVDLAMGGAPNDGGDPITSYDIQHRVSGSGSWNLIAGVSGPNTSHIEDWLFFNAAGEPGAPTPAYTEGQATEWQWRANNGIGDGAWSPSGFVTLDPQPKPLDYSLEPFVLQPPVDFGDADPEADNLSAADTLTYEREGVFERLADGRLRLIVDGNDPGTSPGTDPRVEHRGQTERAADTASSFRVRAQVVSVEDGGTPVAGTSTRLTLAQNYNFGIGNPDLTVDARMDAVGQPFVLRLGWRPNQVDVTTTFEFDTGLTVLPGGVYPEVDFRIDRYADRFEFFFGANAGGVIPDFTSGDSGTPAFTRTGADGDYYLKFGNYLHLDGADPITTRAIVDIFPETSAFALILVPEQSYRRRVAATAFDLAPFITINGTPTLAESPDTADQLPAGFTFSTTNLQGTPTEATVLNDPSLVRIRATGTGGDIEELQVPINVQGPQLQNLVVSATSASATTDEGTGTAYWAFASAPTLTDLDVVNGTGADLLENGNYAISGVGGNAGGIDLTAYVGVAGYFYIVQVAADGAYSLPLFDQVTINAAAPLAFQTGDWTLVDAALGGTATLTITALPDDGGAAISRIDYRVDGGAWTDLGTTTTGAVNITGLTDAVSQDVEIRAVNAADPDPNNPSDTKSVTPTAGVGPSVGTTTLAPTAPATLTATVTTNDGTGTLHVGLILNGSSFPTASDVINQTGNVVAKATLNNPNPSGSNNVDVTGLAANQGYRGFSVHVDGGGLVGPIGDQGGNATTWQVPDALHVANWSVATGSGAGEIDLTLDQEAQDRANGITGVQYEVDASGTWNTVSGYAGVGTYTLTTGLTAGASHAIRIRFVNVVGPGGESGPETATAGAAASSTITFVETSNPPDLNNFGIQATYPFTANAIQGLSNRAAIALHLDGAQEPTAVTVTIGGVAATLVPGAQAVDGARDSESSIWEATGPFSTDEVVVNSEATNASLDDSVCSLFDIGTLAGVAGGSSSSDNATATTRTETTTCQAGDQLIAAYTRSNADSANTSFASGATLADARDADTTTAVSGINTNAAANQAVVWNQSTGTNHKSTAVGVFR